MVLIACTKRLFGASVSTLFGMRLSFSESPLGATALHDLAPDRQQRRGRLDETGAEAAQPIDAMSLPRCGPEMKMTRPTSGR